MQRIRKFMYTGGHRLDGPLIASIGHLPTMKVISSVPYSLERTEGGQFETRRAVLSAAQGDRDIW